MSAALLALAAALAIALSSVVLGTVAGRMGLLRLTQVQMLTALALTGAVALARGGWETVVGWHLQALALSSASGIMLASLTYVATLRSLGPRLTAMLFALASPFALVFGWLFLGEAITPRQGVGVGLILAGVMLALAAPAEGGPGGAVRRVAWGGLVLGVVTAAGQAGGSLFARPAMADGVEPFTAMALRAGMAVVFFAALAGVMGRGRPAGPPVARRDLGLVVLSAALGTGLGMSLLMAALAVGDAGVVTTLSSTTPLMVLPMVWLTGGRRPPVLAWAGAALALPGVALTAGL